jgi:GxxExxY protein
MDLFNKEYTHKLLGCAYRVHTELGPGLLESVYEAALVYELELQGFEVRHQVPVKVNYRGMELDMDLRLDVIVDNSVILELKSVAEIQPVHQKQLLTYMRLTGISLGYLINFNVEYLKDGIERLVNNY